MPTMDSGRKIPAPAVFPETEAFWKAAGEGELLLKHCAACDGTHYFPRAICPFCGSDQTAWKPSAGRGSLYAVSVTRRGPGAPYAIAYVTLDEGVTMLSNVVDCDLDALRIGDRVRVVFRPSEGGPPVPMFTPEGGSA